MSIASMTNIAYARRNDVEPLGIAPKSGTEVEVAAGAKPEASNVVTSAMNSLVTYIPTEILTLYVALVGVLPAPPTSKEQCACSHWISLVAFAIATPLVVLLVYWGRVKTAGKTIELSPLSWPVWEMTAATIAFLAWSFGLPHSPFSTFSWYSAGVAGFTIIATCSLLALLTPIFRGTIAQR